VSRILQTAVIGLELDRSVPLYPLASGANLAWSLPASCCEAHPEID
jgi:hypothetical protein